MQNIIAIIVNILMFAGACLLSASLFPIRRLVLQLPARGSIRKKWNILSILIIFLISGYIGYIVVYWDRAGEDLNLLVPMVFFFSAFFVMGKIIILIILHQILLQSRFSSKLNHPQFEDRQNGHLHLLHSTNLTLIYFLR